MVLNMVVYPCSSLSFVSFPTGDNLMNLIITSCHLVKMIKVIICLLYRPMPFSGAFLVEWQRKVHLVWVPIFYSDR